MQFTGNFHLPVLILALALSLCNANAAVLVTQTDSANGTVSTTGTAVGFDVTNANSIMVATIYVDNDSPSLTNVRFGDGNGIGSGDVAPDFTATIDGRLHSYLFINPSTDSGLSFRLDSGTNAGAGFIFYEISGANPSLASINFIPGSNSITTNSADELIVSFGGNNATAVPTVNGASIFADEDVSVLSISGGGGIASASATAPSIGSNNITWNLGGQAPGRIAYSFEAAPIPIPEPKTALLGGLGLLAMLRRRR